jgi:hypothetical protein
LFKCSRFSCKYFTEGFRTPDDREKHVGRHERPARCTDERYRGFKIGFATKTQLERHPKENHLDIAERRHNFPTDEEISESMREYPEPEAKVGLQSQPAPEPPLPLVIAEPAMSSALEEAAPQPTPPKETYKRQKTKHDYVCERCNKKFDKRYN